MLNSLIHVKFNWNIFTGIAIIIYLAFPDLSGYSYFAILITLHQFTLLFNAIGYVIPVRYLFGAFMCLQLLLGPMLAYNGLDKFQVGYYKMQIPEEQYFAYLIPAVLAFITGLHIRAGKLEGEMVNTAGIEKFVKQNSAVPYIFIAIGFVASIIAEFFSSDFAFLFYLLAGFKFVGAFMIILGNRKLKVIPLIIVYGSIILSSLGQGMFHDLLTWIIFLASVFAIKYKPRNNIKLALSFSFIFISLAIQQLKTDYRVATWERKEEAGIASINKAYEESQEKNSFFSYKSLATSNIRFNQGYIVTNIMKTVPAKVPHAYGEELAQILEAAFLPRILAPDKLKAGNQTIFKKYSGMPLSKGTSMGLSSVGDAYINFGVTGGCIFMFLFGMFFSEVLKIFYRQSKMYPVLLLFIPLVFYYPIRPDCELQTLLGHLVKSCFLIFIVFALWKK
jgi:hypothetical protein